MAIILTASVDSYVQLITVLIVFVAVLGLTALTTKWIANYQKQQSVNCNIEVIETTRISNNKYIQIVRVGEKYIAMAVCRDTVTVLCEVPEEQLKKVEAKASGFKELLESVMKKDSSNPSEPKE